MRTALWSILALTSVACGSSGLGTAAEGRASPRSPSRVDQSQSAEELETPSDKSPTPAEPEPLVITGAIDTTTDDVAGLVAAVEAHARAVGGAVAREEVEGEAHNQQASLTLRLPPGAVTGFVAWVSERATVESRNLQVTDVARELVDRELAVRNLEITMARLQELAQRPNAELKDVIVIEQEMTRVRGEIEKLRGAQRLRADQVARATLVVAVRPRVGVRQDPQLKFELVPRLSLLHLVDAGARPADRVGLGVSTMFSRWFSLELEVLPARGGEARSYLFTMGTAMYSDFLGAGRRRLGNPYLGLRVGGATMNGTDAFAYGAEVGVELVRLPRLLVEISGRALGLRYGHDSVPRGDLLLEGTIGVGVPF